ncbi:ABC transporter permease [Halobacteria archaeon AArc-curdl1]|uniref:ABC transporter permease n=1 Tax=Natronosalvus hydrolyticus TaxID=2979988 RepID=A0AAP2Z762_9EURY|nr:ABC transporter permease [Halobacteria archaeon AArc-curdl1]
MSTETDTQTDIEIDEPGPFHEFYEAFSENRIAVFGLGLLAFLIIITLLADFIAPYSATAQNYDAVLEGPSMDHPMGTDELGRDIFSRVLFGYRIIFSITVGGVMMAFTMGTLLGLAAGYYGGWLDEFLMRGVDVLMSFPSLILALALIAAIGPSRWGIALVLGIAYTPIFARVARSESVSLSNEAFIRSLEVRGVSTPRILIAHMFPNVLGPLIVTVTLQLAFGILTTATLSFLGVGVQPPSPSLGLMLADGKDIIGRAWWMSLFPGVAIMLPVIAFNTIGDGLRDTFDPKQVRN